jgi:hypothetical protein
LTGIGEYLLAGKDDSPRSTTDDERGRDVAALVLMANLPAGLR